MNGFGVDLGLVEPGLGFGLYVWFVYVFALVLGLVFGMCWAWGGALVGLGWAGFFGLGHGYWFLV